MGIGVPDSSNLAGGDNPTYVQDIAATVADNDVAFQTYFYAHEWATQLQTGPLSLSAYRAAFGDGGYATAGGAGAPPAPVQLPGGNPLSGGAPLGGGAPAGGGSAAASPIAPTTPARPPSAPATRPPAKKLAAPAKKTRPTTRKPPKHTARRKTHKRKVSRPRHRL